MQEPLDGRRVIISGKVKEISNDELAAKFEEYGRVERITAGFMTDIAFALFEQNSAVQAACTAAKGGLQILNFSLSVRKTNEHVFRQSCKIYNVGPTFPLSPFQGSLRMQQDLEQKSEKNVATYPLHDAVNNELADVQESMVDQAGTPDSCVINFNIAGGDKEKTPDKVWSCNWADLQTDNKLPDVSSAKRRRSRRKGQKKGKGIGKADGERRWRSSSKPPKGRSSSKPPKEVPSTVGRSPCTEGRVGKELPRRAKSRASEQCSLLSGKELAARQSSHGTASCYDLSTPQLRPFACPSNRVVEDLEDLDAKSDSSCFWEM